jgi:hypothetical protein
MNNRPDNHYIETKDVQKLFLILAAGEFFIGNTGPAFRLLVSGIFLEVAVNLAKSASPYLQQGAHKAFLFFQTMAEKPATPPAATPRDDLARSLFSRVTGR